MQRILRFVGACLGICVLSPAFAVAQSPGTCSEQFDSTFALIEKVIFERHGCASVTCHSGTTPAGGLNLSAGLAYDNLVDQPAQTVSTDRHPGLARVVPGNKGRSLLWLNLAGASLSELWQAPLRPMPLGGSPLRFEELDLVRMWIEYGATRDGVVPGTGDAFDACLPPPKPLKVEPLAPPPAGVGVQLRAPRQMVPLQSERETCFVSYYDFTDQVPPQFRSPDGQSFRYKRVDARQDPLSHHAVVIVYKGQTPITSRVWGTFACRDGAHDGQSCVPTDLGACGPDALCASPPVQSVACIGYGPGDAGIGVAEESLFSTMGVAIGGELGVYGEAPITGTLVWNSHAFNITDTPAPLDMWINFEFAPPAEQQHPLERFVDISAIAKMHVPPYGAEEICQHHVVPAGARLLEIASHTHKRGKRFRVFEGKFACAGGPKNGDPCTPFGPEPGFPVVDLCAGAPCTSRMPPRVGDCDGDLAVRINELVTGVSISLETAPLSACRRFDGDANEKVTVDELVAGIGAALSPALRDAAESLTYTTLTYADPLILSFSPPKLLGDHNSVPAERTLTYCALYDNGFDSQEEVKRNSLVPTNGGPCRPTHCAEGRVGDSCQTDAQCDTAPGADDGFCDACSVGFSITTDDEMFVLVGSYVQD